MQNTTEEENFTKKDLLHIILAIPLFMVLMIYIVICFLITVKIVTYIHGAII